MKERLKQLRKTLGLTQQEFADRLNVPRNTIGGYEVGKSNPSDAAVNNICITFNINENWLRTGEGEMFSEPFNNSSIGERIKLLRKELNMTQQKFAEGIHIKRNTIATYESNRNEPIDAVVSLICMQYNVNERWLRNGNGEMFNTLSARLKTLRNTLSLTQQEFADRLNVPRNTIGGYEVGKSNPSDAAVNNICITFNINENWLRTGEGEMFSESFGSSNISERLRILRKKLDMTQQEFADKIGSKRNTIAKYETNTNIPSTAVISLICREFNVDECWLRTGTGEIFVHQTDDEQLASFIVKILANKSTSFKRKFISMLSVLDESDWDVLEKMVTLLKKED